MNILIINKKKILIIIISLQLALVGLITINILGLNIPILRNIIATIYLTFIPGILILRILKLDNYLNDIVEILIFSVGLSISSLTFLGIFFNFLYPLLGINKPFSELPLTIGMSVFVTLLAILCLFRDSNKVYLINLDFRPYYIFALLLPILSVFGTHMLNYQNDNILLLVSFGIIALVPLLVSFGKIKESLYSILIWSIGLSLLYYGANTKPLCNGEKYMPGVVALMGYWDPTLKEGHNMLLPNVILHPFYIIITDIPFTWEWRIIHPLLFSIVPVLLYRIFSRFVDAKVAFLSTFLAISTYPFIIVISSQIRTPMAIFYLVFFEFLIVDNKIPNIIKSSLILLFSFLLITSHYGTAFLFLAVLIVGFIVYYILSRISKEKISKISTTYILVYMVLAFSWYIYVAGGEMFTDISRFFARFFELLITFDFFNPCYSYTAYALERHYTVSIEIAKYMYIFVYLIITIKLLDEIYNYLRKGVKTLDSLYLSISLGFLGILISTFLPIKAYNTARVIFITLTFLAPFCILGFSRILKIIFKTLKLSSKNSRYNIVVYTFSVFLIIFFLFNSGFVSEIVIKDVGPYPLISKKRILDGNNTEQKLYLYRFYAPLYDIEMCKWITKCSDKNKIVYSDFFVGEKTLRYRLSFIPEYGLIPGHNNRPKEHRLTENTIVVKSNYILLGYHNIKDKLIVSSWCPTKYFSISKLYFVLYNSSKIYDNSNSQIYYT